MARGKRDDRELGRSILLPDATKKLWAGIGDQLHGGPETEGCKSDHLIVVRDGRTASHVSAPAKCEDNGEGVAGMRSPQRKHDPDKKDCKRHANLTAGNSESCQERPEGPLREPLRNDQ